MYYPPDGHSPPPRRGEEIAREESPGEFPNWGIAVLVAAAVLCYQGGAGSVALFFVLCLAGPPALGLVYLGIRVAVILLSKKADPKKGRREFNRKE